MKKSAIWLGLIGIIFIPLILFFSKISGDWLQFYGAYLGIIVSVFMSLYVTRKQSEIDNKNHAIDIYISNLMKFLDTLSRLDKLSHRCEKFVKSVESEHVKSDAQDNELKLLINSISNDEVKEVIADLENIINRMPANRQNRLKGSLNCLSSSRTFFGDEDNINEDINQYVGISKTFVKSYTDMKNYATKQLDYYNKID